MGVIMEAKLKAICDGLKKCSNHLTVLSFCKSIQALTKILEVVEDNTLDSKFKLSEIHDRVLFLESICSKYSIKILYEEEVNLSLDFNITSDYLSVEIFNILISFELFYVVKNTFLVEVPIDIIKNIFHDDSLLKEELNFKRTRGLIIHSVGTDIVFNGVFRVFLYFDLLLNTDEFEDNRELQDIILSNKLWIEDTYISGYLLKYVEMRTNLRLIYLDNGTSNTIEDTICLLLINMKYNMVENPVYYFNVSGFDTIKSLCLFKIEECSANITSILEFIMCCKINCTVPIRNVLYYSSKFVSTDSSCIEKIFNCVKELNLINTKLLPEVNVKEDLRNLLVLLTNNIFTNCSNRIFVESTFLRNFFDYDVSKDTYEYIAANVNGEATSLLIPALEHSALSNLYYKSVDFLKSKYRFSSITAELLFGVFGDLGGLWNMNNTLNKSVANLENICAWIIYTWDNVRFKGYFSQSESKKIIIVINYFYLSPLNYFKLIQHNFNFTVKDFGLIGLTDYYILAESVGGNEVKIFGTLVGLRCRYFNTLTIITENNETKRLINEKYFLLPGTLSTIKESILDNVSIGYDEGTIIIYFSDDMIPVYYNIGQGNFIYDLINPVYTPKLRNDLISNPSEIYFELDAVYSVRLEVEKFVYICERTKLYKANDYDEIMNLDRSSMFIK